MKESSASRKTLNAIKEALHLGIPLSGAVAAAACLTGAAPGQAPAKAGNQPKEASKSSVEESEKTISIDTMTLSCRWGVTPGITYPPPTVVRVKSYNVKAGDTWESLAKRHKTTFEIMMRINDVPAGTVLYVVVEAKKIPENLKLRPGQRIYVPVAAPARRPRYVYVRKGREEAPRQELGRDPQEVGKAGERVGEENREPSPASADKPKK